MFNLFFTSVHTYTVLLVVNKVDLYQRSVAPHPFVIYISKLYTLCFTIWGGGQSSVISCTVARWNYTIGWSCFIHWPRSIAKYLHHSNNSATSWSFWQTIRCQRTSFWTKMFKSSSDLILIAIWTHHWHGGTRKLATHVSFIRSYSN